MRQTKNAEYSLRISIRRCFEFILTGNDAEIADGWLMLSELQDDKQFSQMVDCEDVLRDILNGDVLNVSEVPKIMAWISPHIKSKSDDIEPISNDVAILLHRINIRDLSQLAAILKTMLDHSVYLPRTANHMALCEAVILSLSVFQMPPEPKKITEFYENAAKIEEFLRVVCLNMKHGELDVLFTCLQTLYNVISDVDRKQEPGPGLALILNLVEPGIIAQAVDCILSQSQSSCQLVQALTVLCNWLPQWHTKQLSIWIMEFIFGLEKQDKCSILLEVMESSLDIQDLMYKILLLPMMRQNSSYIIYHILKRLSSQTVIQSIVKVVPSLIRSLIREDTDSSKECMQYLVDIVKVMGLRFPAYRIPDIVESTFPVSPRMRIVRDIYSEPIWKDETKNFDTFMLPQRQLVGKVGLTNLGNTCYMNSVLQALLMTRQFCHEILNHPVEADKTPLLRKLQDLFALLLHSKRTTLSPTEVLQESRPTYFQPGQQQDSSEFLCHLLDVLHEQEKSSNNTNCKGNEPTTNLKYKIETQYNEVTSSIDSTEGTIKRWITEEDLTEGMALRQKTQSLADFPQDVGQVERLSDNHSDSTDSGIQSVGGEESSVTISLVHKVLGGESKITYQCAQCDTSSHNTDKFRDLQLCFPEEISENQEVSVQDLINCYLAPEKLTGENKYRCNKCMKLCDAQRIITILQAPAHLILSLKHFRYDFDSRLRTKLRHKVVYNDTIQLPVIAPSSTVAETYHLYAAVVHSGYSMDYGHYFTYACDSKHNWYRFNDSFVSHTTFNEFKSLKPPDTPYILFYEKSGVLDGLYEDNKPELSTLSKHLQELIMDDTTTYIEELRQQAALSRRNRYPTTVAKPNDNSDDENPPSSSCRGAIDIPANHFLY